MRPRPLDRFFSFFHLVAPPKDLGLLIITHCFENLVNVPFSALLPHQIVFFVPQYMHDVQHEHVLS